MFCKTLNPPGAKVTPTKEELGTGLSVGHTGAYQEKEYCFFLLFEILNEKHTIM